jgi:hypothetical protein
MCLAGGALAARIAAPARSARHRACRCKAPARLWPITKKASNIFIHISFDNYQ